MSRSVVETNTEPETRPVLIRVEIVDQGFDAEREQANPESGFMTSFIVAGDLRDSVGAVAGRAVQKFLAGAPKIEPPERFREPWMPYEHNSAALEGGAAGLRPVERSPY